MHVSPRTTWGRGAVLGGWVALMDGSGAGATLPAARDQVSEARPRGASKTGLGWQSRGAACIVSRMRRAVPVLVLLTFFGCSGEEPAVPTQGEIVTPPFEVRGEGEGLLLVWFDEGGQHTASRRSEIPEAHRAMVRVDDLTLAPEQGLDPSLVYVADLSSPGEEGRYTVRRIPRESFEAQIEVATGPTEVAETGAGAEGAGGAEVIIYGASWCSACRSTAAFLREQNVPFVERDIEREPGARQAMMEAAQAAGVSPNGIPVIDFSGEIITGFNRARLQRAIERSRTTI